MKIGKQFKALSLAAFAAMALAAIDFGPRRSAKPAPGYTPFAECPSAVSECVHNTIKGGKEKVTYSLNAIQRSVTEFSFVSADRPCEQIILGNACYVGDENPFLDTENNDQTKSFYELRQRKDHLA